jgi:hypothetical protein
MIENKSPKEEVIDQMLQALEDQDQEKFINLTWELLQLNKVNKAG